LAAIRFVFSSPAHPPFMVVRHDSIAYRLSVDTSIFRVVSSCFAGTDEVHPYTATSRVRFIRGPVVTRKRRGVGRQRVIARSDYCMSSPRSGFTIRLATMYCFCWKVIEQNGLLYEYTSLHTPTIYCGKKKKEKMDFPATNN